ncbi:MAG: cell envelope integrity protein TolA [Deltaproteobacteria bacterium]|nr:cell envelope integrity protein TolA [Deltaproteobacteria bacterium]
MSAGARQGTDGYMAAHVSGAIVSVVAHVAAVIVLLLVHGDAAGRAGAGSPQAFIPPPPAVKARLVKLGRPLNTARTRTSTVVSTAPRDDIHLSRTGAEETQKRTNRVQAAKNALDDDALRRTLAHAAALGEQGDPHAGEGSPDGVEGGEIDAAEAQEIDLYITMLQRLFRSGFRVPQTVENASELRASVRVMINRNLSVGAPVVAQSSGNPTFDESARAAIRAVSTVPPPPTEIADRVLGRSIRVNFRGSQN